MAARRLGNCCGPNPRSRRNEPAPAIPATRRQALGTRTGFRAEAIRDQKLHHPPGRYSCSGRQVRGPWAMETRDSRRSATGRQPTWPLRSSRLPVSRRPWDRTGVAHKCRARKSLGRFRPAALPPRAALALRSLTKTTANRRLLPRMRCGSGLALKDWAFLPCSPLSLEVCKLTSELQFEQRVFHIGARHRLLAGKYGQVAVERRARINKVPGCLCQQVYHPCVRFVNDHQAMDAVFWIWEFVGATVRQ